MAGRKLNHTHIVLEAATVADLATVSDLFRLVGCPVTAVTGQRLRGAVANESLDDLRLHILATNEQAGFPAVQMI